MALCKWMLVARRPAEATREAFLSQWRAEAARLAQRPGVQRVVAHEALPDDALLAARQQRAPRPHRADVVTSLWIDEEADPSWRGAVVVASHANVRALPVDEVVHWEGAEEQGDAEPSPGLTLLYFVFARPGLARDAFVARYREGHAPLARVHHPGIARYVQNFLRADAEVPSPCDAVAELAFRSEQDLRERFYRDATSPRRIADDVAAFLDLTRGFALVTRRRVVKDEARGR